MDPLRFSNCSLRKARIKASTAVAADLKYEILHEKGRRGFFVYGVWTLGHASNLLAILELDDTPLLEHSHNDLEAAAAGDLNLDQGDNAGNLIHIPDSSTGYEVIVLDCHQRPWPFHNELFSGVKNTSSGSLNIIAAYMIYALDRRVE